MSISDLQILPAQDISSAKRTQIMGHQNSYCLLATKTVILGSNF